MIINNLPDVSDAYGPLTPLSRGDVENMIDEARKVPDFDPFWHGSGSLNYVREAADEGLMHVGRNGTIVVDMRTRLDGNSIDIFPDVLQRPVVVKNTCASGNFSGGFFLKFHFDGDYYYNPERSNVQCLRTVDLQPSLTYPLPVIRTSTAGRRSDILVLGEAGCNYYDEQFRNAQGKIAPRRVNKKWIYSGEKYKRVSMM